MASKTNPRPVITQDPITIRPRQKAINFRAAFTLLRSKATQLYLGMIDATAITSWPTTVAGVTLTTGDVPFFAYVDKDGTPHVVVATDGDALAIRS